MNYGAVFVAGIYFHPYINMQWQMNEYQLISNNIDKMWMWTGTGMHQFFSSTELSTFIAAFRMHAKYSVKKYHAWHTDVAIERTTLLSVMYVCMCSNHMDCQCQWSVHTRVNNNKPHSKHRTRWSLCNYCIYNTKYFENKIDEWMS